MQSKAVISLMNTNKSSANNFFIILSVPVDRRTADTASLLFVLRNGNACMVLTVSENFTTRPHDNSAGRVIRSQISKTSWTKRQQSCPSIIDCLKNEISASKLFMRSVQKPDWKTQQKFPPLENWISLYWYRLIVSTSQPHILQNWTSWRRHEREPTWKWKYRSSN